MYCLDTMGPIISDYNKRLMLLSVIQISGWHYTSKRLCNSLYCNLFSEAKCKELHSEKRTTHYLKPSCHAHLGTRAYCNMLCIGYIGNNKGVVAKSRVVHSKTHRSKHICKWLEVATKLLLRIE